MEIEQHFKREASWVLRGKVFRRKNPQNWLIKQTYLYRRIFVFIVIGGQ